MVEDYHSGIVPAFPSHLECNYELERTDERVMEHGNMKDEALYKGVTGVSWL